MVCFALCLHSSGEIVESGLGREEEAESPSAKATAFSRNTRGSPLRCHSRNKKEESDGRKA